MQGFFAAKSEGISVPFDTRISRSNRLKRGTELHELVANRRTTVEISGD